MRRPPDKDSAQGRRGPVVRAIAWFTSMLEEESDRWFLWLPVLFGIGIGTYFSLHSEPGALPIGAALVAALSLHLLTARTRLLWLVSVAALVSQPQTNSKN